MHGVWFASLKGSRSVVAVQCTSSQRCLLSRDALTKGGRRQIGQTSRQSHAGNRGWRKRCLHDTGTSQRIASYADLSHLFCEQEADIGVGISGREGLQAARAADYRQRDRSLFFVWRFLFNFVI